MTQTRSCLALLLAAILFGPTAFAEDWTEQDTQRLVEAVRHPPVADCWTIMTGEVRHRSAGKPTIKLPVQLRGRFSPTRSHVQLIFNEHEWYLIGQNFDEGMTGTSVIQQKPPPEGATTLQDIGIRPSDITLSFLYWKFVGDLGDDSYKGRDCRILSFHHPEADETVRVWVSTKYQFPMQVYWFRGEEKEPYRRLEITKLKKINDVWIVSVVKVSNPGWKTELRFPDIELKNTTADAPIPADLFLKE